MVIYLAACRASRASTTKRLRSTAPAAFASFGDITLPLLTPTTFFLMVIAIIGSLQVFDLVFIMARVGNTNRFPTIVYYIYQEGFQNFRMGYAITVAWVLLMIILVFTLLQFRLQRRWVHYA